MCRQFRLQWDLLQVTFYQDHPPHHHHGIIKWQFQSRKSQLKRMHCERGNCKRHLCLLLRGLLCLQVVIVILFIVILVSIGIFVSIINFVDINTIIISLSFDHPVKLMTPQRILWVDDEPEQHLRNHEQLFNKVPKNNMSFYSYLMPT